MGIDAFSHKDNGHEESANKIALAALARARNEVEHITDGLNRSIDDGIREAVAVFRALSIDTTQSCEGHLDRGSPSPYIDVRALGEPTLRFRGEREELQAIAKKHSITPEEITAWPLEEDRALRAEKAHLEWQIWSAHLTRAQTPEYQAWDTADRKTQGAIEKLIAEFYTTRQKPTEGHVLLDDGGLRTTSALYDQYFDAALAGNASPLSNADRERLRTQLPAAQTEMQAFIDFLKAKFFGRAQQT